MNHSYKSNTEKKRIGSVSDIASAVLFCSVIALGGILTAVLPGRVVSENENRSLMTKTELFSGNFADKLFSGKFKDQAGDFCRDQFPWREEMLELRAVSDMALVRYETNAVLYGTDGYLIPRRDYTDIKNVPVNTQAIHALKSALEAEKIPTVFAVAPRPADVLERYYPSGYSSGALSGVRETIFSAGDGIDLLPVLKAAADNGESVYYKTDHHWTAYGAYLAYRTLCPALGMEPIPAETFQRETVSQSFLGTSYSKVMTPFAEPDTMEYWHLDDDSFTTEIRNGATFSGFYDRSYLDKKDKYSSYIGGNNAYVRVTKNSGENRPTMLLIKDSYAHSMVPYLAQHYDLIIIDPRYYWESAYLLAQECGADCVLILCGADSLTDSDSFRGLSYLLPEGK